ncbi:DUF1489 family protein [Martelella mediterranea]|uniref:DUF1489 family protein n=1 Tax=Martelella mediterranea TaxID=293089 RepID=A0A4R3NVN5_9HYPH|nr:DUF1489 family protein [Martelella mediterranea]TCT40935.1 hypothetical protein EDC90_100875 [Martelella mediterranea]
MSLHLLKLCVGATAVDDLRGWVSERSMAAIAAGLEPHTVHTTRMTPKRREELLEGGSLYWVIGGQIRARQELLEIGNHTDGQGIERCDLVLAPQVIDTVPVPRKPFQGWRYLKAEDAPRDLDVGEGGEEMPDELRAELAALGLL